jgi:hypothetical protein
MKLIGWTMTEGRIPGEYETRDPSVSAVAAALEAIHEYQRDPYVILTAPEVDGLCAGFCQTVACEDASYRCEIRLFGRNGEEDRHYLLSRPDEHGRCGGDEPGRPGYMAGYDPDLATMTAVFMAFIRNPWWLPGIPGWQWLQIPDEVQKEIDEDT